MRGELAGLEPCQRFVGILFFLRDRRAAFQGVGRFFAGDGDVQGCAQRVNVGPGALLADGFVVLLHRRVARRNQRRQRMGLLPHGLPRRTEIDQYRAAVVAQYDVVWLDVSVNESFFVHPAQPVEDRQDNQQQLFFAKRRAGLDQG